MTLITGIVIGFVALLHIGFLVLEMFLWTKPFGRKTFRMTEEYAQASASLAANQGLYNGFLAAGLIWGLITGDFATKALPGMCTDRRRLWRIDSEAYNSLYAGTARIDRPYFSLSRQITALAIC